MKLIGLCSVVVGLLLGFQAQAVNPILPSWEYIPDGEPRVFGDRVYLYGSHDRAWGTTYCDYQLRVWSAPLTNLNEWFDHGISFSTITTEGHTDDVPYSNSRLYAPDVVQGSDGKYYLYAYVVGSPCAVGVSTNPGGPFAFVSEVRRPPGEQNSFGGWGQYIDPGVLVDDDNKVYLCWGYHQSHMAQLSNNMVDVLANTYQADPIPTNAPFNFFEAASPRKINGRYYLIYADGGKLVYATSTSPTGPFAYGGIMVMQGNGAPGGNIHGSLAQINGQWYIFYHRMSHNTLFSRRACVEKVTIKPDGSIDQVEQTSLGFQDSLNPYQKTSADIACVLKNGPYIVEVDTNTHPVILNKATSVIGYKYFEFGTVPANTTNLFSAQIRGGPASGQMEVWLDSDTTPAGTKIGTVNITNPAATNTLWREVSAPVTPLGGRRALYLKFTGSGGGSTICDIASFQFCRRISLTNSDASDSSSFKAKLNWNDSAAPKSTNAYFTAAFTLRTPVNQITGTNLVFDGQSLTVNSNGSLALKNSTTSGSGYSLTVTNLTLAGGAINQAQNTSAGGNSWFNLDGNSLAVTGNSVIQSEPGNGETRILTINSHLHGNGGLLYTNSGGSGAGVFQVNLRGTNINFTGTHTLGANAANAAAELRLNLGNETVLGTAPVVLRAGSVALENTSGGTIAISNLISGTGGFSKLGPDALVLAATNTYTGATTIKAGALLINGSIAGGAVTVSNGATLGGTGVIAGPVTVNGTLAPGAGGVGRLTVSNSLTLAGNIVFEINKSSSPSNDTVVVTGALTGGGNLIVTNPGPMLTVGDSYSLFSKAVSGSFANVTLPVLETGLAWSNRLALDGRIVIVGVLPAAPDNLSATAAGPYRVNLTWRNNATNATGFKIERKTGAGGIFAEVATTGAVTNFSDTTVAGETVYFYRVRATNHGGDSAFSNEAGATTGANPPACELIATAVATNRVNLVWRDNATNETGFVIERKTGAGGSYSQIASVGVGVTNYSNTNLSANTLYYYRVAANTTSGLTPYSNEAGVSTPPFPPGVPAGLTAVTVSTNRIDLTWTDTAANETGFKLQRKTGVNGAYGQIAALPANTTSFSDTGLAERTTYYYRVCASNGGGDSAFSNEANATTARLNLALNKPATASSVVGGNAATNAVDGAGNTRWESSFSDPQWMRVDLGALYNLDAFRIVWEYASAKAYQIQVSTNDSNWTTIYSTTNGPGGTESFTNLPVATARCVRIYGTQRATQYGYSIWELEVYGTALSAIVPPSNLAGFPWDHEIELSWNEVPGAASYNLKRANSIAGPFTLLTNITGLAFTETNLVMGATNFYVVSMRNGGIESSNSAPLAIAPRTNLTLNRPATSSSNENASNTPDKAVDGIHNTRWSSAYADTNWIRVDLGAVRNLDSFRIYWEAAYSKAYELQVSSNDSTWTTIYSTTNCPGGVDVFKNLTASGRYLRMYGTKRSTTYGHSIWELEAYGPPVNATVGPASNPNPANGTINLTLTPTLNWTPGANALSHRIFFGANSNSIATATTNSPEFKGALTATNYAPGTLASSGRYFWRVDEVGASSSTNGVIWTFATLVNPDGKPQIAGAYNGNFSVGFPSQIGQNYRVERTDSLSPADWQVVSNNIPGTGSVIQIPDSNSGSSPQRFYRVVIQTP